MISKACFVTGSYRLNIQMKMPIAMFSFECACFVVGLSLNYDLEYNLACCIACSVRNQKKKTISSQLWLTYWFFCNCHNNHKTTDAGDMWEKKGADEPQKKKWERKKRLKKHQSFIDAQQCCKLPTKKKNNNDMTLHVHALNNQYWWDRVWNEIEKRAQTHE